MAVNQYYVWILKPNTKLHNSHHKYFTRPMKQLIYLLLALLVFDHNFDIPIHLFSVKAEYMVFVSENNDSTTDATYRRKSRPNW